MNQLAIPWELPEPRADRAQFELAHNEILHAGGMKSDGWYAAIEPDQQNPGYYYISGVDEVGAAFGGNRAMNTIGVCLLLNRVGLSFDRMKWKKLPYNGEPKFHDAIMGTIYPCKGRSSRIACRHCDVTWQVKNCEHMKGIANNAT